MKYRKKPVVVEAHQWWENGDHPDDNQWWVEIDGGSGFWSEGQVVRYYRRPDDDGERICGTCGFAMHVHGWIDTAEGGHIVCPGDYIIKDVRAREGHHGYHYPCKPNIFEATYEPVVEDADTHEWRD